MSDVENARWQDSYQLLAQLWSSPQDVDMVGLYAEADTLASQWESAEPEIADALRLFLQTSPLPADQYIDWFELEPTCALYLGSHAFSEPEGCAGSAKCERNRYMVELLNYYRHFGWQLAHNELPDYLPLMLEFLALTSAQRDDGVRRRFVEHAVLPYLPALGVQLGAFSEQYHALWQASCALLQRDVRTSTVATADCAGG